MNEDASIVARIMMEEGYFTLELLATYGDPEALATIDEVRERLYARVAAARLKAPDGLKGDDLYEWLNDHVR